MPRPNPILDALTNPAKNFLAFFVVGVLLFNVFSDGLSALFWDSFGGWLKGTTGIQNPVALRGLVLLVLSGIMLLVIYATNLTDGLRWVLTKLRLVDAVVPRDAKVVPLTAPCRGLVAIMSTNDNSPAEVAVRYHWNGGQPPHLEFCWLITTPDALPYARKLHQRLVDEGIAERLTLFYGDSAIPDLANLSQPLTLTVNQAAAHDPDSTLHLVNSIYAHAQSLDLAETDLIVDFTGGTKPLGVGAFLACTRPGRRLQYIASREPPELLEIKIDYQLKPVK